MGFTIHHPKHHQVLSKKMTRTTTLLFGEKKRSYASSEYVSFGADAVPEGQRPVNEYLDLRNAPLFDWASQDVGTKGFMTRLAAVYVVSFVAICFPIAGATFTQEGFLLQKLAASNVGSASLIMLLLVRLYSGWGYVSSRLLSPAVEYEETGWYDGEVEPKTKEEMARDAFLHSNEVQPVVERLKITMLGVAVFWIVSCVGLKATAEAKPMFNQYDAEVLERVRYDEKLAGIAAQQSNGRPSYCDSRYYRAVANGGLGCDK